MQYVKLDLSGRAYTYAWPFEDVTALEVGDEVRIPGNSVNPKEAKARVIRLLPESDWDGEVTEILGLACPEFEDRDDQPCSWCLEPDCRGGCLL